MLEGVLQLLSATNNNKSPKMPIYKMTQYGETTYRYYTFEMWNLSNSEKSYVPCEMVLGLKTALKASKRPFSERRILIEELIEDAKNFRCNDIVFKMLYMASKLLTRKNIVYEINSDNVWHTLSSDQRIEISVKILSDLLHNTQFDNTYDYSEDAMKDEFDALYNDISENFDDELFQTPERNASVDPERPTKKPRLGNNNNDNVQTNLSENF